MTLEREELDIRTPDGVAHAWTIRGGKGALPAVLLYTDAFGVRPAMHEIAERIAALGYFVMLPDVFYRSRPFAPFDAATTFGTPSERGRLMGLMQQLTPERIAADAGAYLDAIAAQRDVRADRIGTTGYCMGGRMSFLTAGQHPARVRAAASFHGGRLVTDDAGSPHKLATGVKASLYLAVADEDASCSPEHQSALAAALGAAHVDYCIELYQGKRHGFAVPDNVGPYDKDAADRHWRRIESFFGETLSAGA